MYSKSLGPRGRGPKGLGVLGPRPLGPWDLRYLGLKVWGPEVRGLRAQGPMALESQKLTLHFSFKFCANRKIIPGRVDANPF